MSDDTFHTIAQPCEALFKDKGSRFLAYAYPIHGEEEVKSIISQLKKEHHSARHHCYAWRLGLDENNYRANDDGEPSGTAGRPILGQITSRNLTDILIVVVRYFGGTLLGVSGLINAYRESSKNVLDNAEIIEKIVEQRVAIRFSYAAMNAVMQLVKEFQLEIIHTDFALVCHLEILVRLSILPQVIEKLSNIEGVENIDCEYNEIK